MTIIGSFQAQTCISPLIQSPKEELSNFYWFANIFPSCKGYEANYLSLFDYSSVYSALQEYSSEKKFIGNSWIIENKCALNNSDLLSGGFNISHKLVFPSSFDQNDLPFNDTLPIIGLNVFHQIFQKQLSYRELAVLVKYVRNPEDTHNQMIQIVNNTFVGAELLKTVNNNSEIYQAAVHNILRPRILLGQHITTVALEQITSNIRIYWDMFLHHKQQFLIEVLRLHPPIINVTMQQQNGTPLNLVIMDANKDRTVFGGPKQRRDRAEQFDPLRPSQELDRVLLFNISDIVPRDQIQKNSELQQLLNLSEKIIEFFVSDESKLLDYMLNSNTNDQAEVGNISSHAYLKLIIIGGIILWFMCKIMSNKHISFSSF